MAMHAARANVRNNPRNDDEARTLVRHVESLFMPWNIDALVDGFTDDCVVRFGMVAEFRGREKLREFFIARATKQIDYRLAKQFRSLSGNTIANIWDGKRKDSESGIPIRGFGVELWQMREGKIATWEAAFNIVRADQDGGVADVLR